MAIKVHLDPKLCDRADQRSQLYPRFRRVFRPYDEKAAGGSDKDGELRRTTENLIVATVFIHQNPRSQQDLQRFEFKGFGSCQASMLTKSVLCCVGVSGSINWLDFTYYTAPELGECRGESCWRSGTSKSQVQGIFVGIA